MAEQKILAKTGDLTRRAAPCEYKLANHTKENLPAVTTQSAPGHCYLHMSLELSLVTFALLQVIKPTIS